MGKTIRIGRSSDNDVVIADPSVSRHHCEITSDGCGNYRLKDVGSSNGTFVNGRKIMGEVRISGRDVIKIGLVPLPWRNYFSEDLTDVFNEDQETHIVEPIPSYSGPSINIPSEININQNVKSEHADVRKRGDDFSVGFLRNLGDEMGSGIGKTLGCVISIIIVIAILAIIGVTCS